MHFIDCCPIKHLSQVLHLILIFYVKNLTSFPWESLIFVQMQLRWLSGTISWYSCCMIHNGMELKASNLFENEGSYAFLLLISDRLQALWNLCKVNRYSCRVCWVLTGLGFICLCYRPLLSNRWLSPSSTKVLGTFPVIMKTFTSKILISKFLENLLDFWGDYFIFSMLIINFTQWVNWYWESHILLSLLNSFFL
jgi:hypothetical protein